MQANERELASRDRELARKERELAEAQQQLRQKVNSVKCIMCCVFVTRGPPDCRKNSCDPVRL